MYVHMYVYVRMYICMYVCMYVCTYVYVYVCKHACMYMQTYVCAYAHIYIRTYAYIVHHYVCIILQCIIFQSKTNRAFNVFLITAYISRISAMPANGTVSDPQDVICSITSTTVLDANSVTTSWTGPNGVITNDDRLTINTTVDNNIYTTILHFDHLLESDEGIYICNITTTDHSVSLSTNFTDLISKLSIAMHSSEHTTVCTYVHIHVMVFILYMENETLLIAIKINVVGVNLSFYSD